MKAQSALVLPAGVSDVQSAEKWKRRRRCEEREEDSSRTGESRVDGELLFSLAQATCVLPFSLSPSLELRLSA